MSKVQETAPEEIFLIVGPNGDTDFKELFEVTWADELIYEETAIKYVKQPKLSIPKKIAEGLDEENYKDLIDFIKEGFFVSEEVDKWYYGINQDQIDENGEFVDNKIDPNKSILIVAYLLSKALGVELVEVSDD